MTNTDILGNEIPESTNEVDLERLRNQARSAADKSLRDAHQDEWRALMTKEHEARGVTWNPRLTPAEKAMAEIKRLAAEHHVDLVTLAEAEIVEAAFVAAETVEVEETVEERRAQAAESLFGGQRPLGA